MTLPTAEPAEDGVVGLCVVSTYPATTWFTRTWPSKPRGRAVATGDGRLLWTSMPINARSLGAGPQAAAHPEWPDSRDIGAVLRAVEALADGDESAALAAVMLLIDLLGAIETQLGQGKRVVESSDRATLELLAAKLAAGQPLSLAVSGSGGADRVSGALLMSLGWVFTCSTFVAESEVSAAGLEPRGREPEVVVVLEGEGSGGPWYSLWKPGPGSTFLPATPHEVDWRRSRWPEDNPTPQVTCDIAALLQWAADNTDPCTTTFETLQVLVGAIATAGAGLFPDHAQTLLRAARLTANGSQNDAASADLDPDALSEAIIAATGCLFSRAKLMP